MNNSKKIDWQTWIKIIILVIVLFFFQQGFQPLFNFSTSVHKENGVKGTDLMQGWGTILSAVFGLVTICLLLWQQNQSNKKELDSFYHSSLPFVVIGSPCFLDQNYCDINILDKPDKQKGCRYFSVGNFGDKIAFSVSVRVSKDEDFKSDTRDYYFGFLLPEKNNLNYYNPRDSEGLFSKTRRNLITKDLITEDFSICDFMSSCSTVDGNIAKLFIQVEYYSSPNTKFAKKFISVFDVKIKCENDPKSLKISSIMITKFDS